MVQLLVEIFGLAFACTICGFTLGFGSARLYGWFGAEGPERDVEGKTTQSDDLSLFEDPAPPKKRIPDPAPPSVSRRKRIESDLHNP